MANSRIRALRAFIATHPENSDCSQSSMSIVRVREDMSDTFDTIVDITIGAFILVVFAIATLVIITVYKLVMANPLGLLGIMLTILACWMIGRIFRRIMAQ